MLLLNEAMRIAKHSGEELTMDDLGLIRRILESMDSPKSFDEKRRPKTGELTYSSVDMLMICAFVEVRKTTYGGAVSDLKDKGGQERLKALGMPMRNGEYRCPSKSTISDFINKTWPKLQKSITQEIVAGILEMLRAAGILITVDSTPLEASRYSERCDYNPHYEIRMDKSHIMMLNGIPLIQIRTGANDSDYKELFNLLASMGGIAPFAVRGFATDGSYHGFAAYAEVFMKTGKVMATNQGIDAKYYEEAEWKDIESAYSKMWKKHDFKPSKYLAPAEKLRYLVKNGKSELVGKFLHNLDCMRGKRIRAQWSLERHVCETKHFQAKRWLRFDVRGLRNDSVDNRISMRFFLLQILTMVFTSD